MTETKEMDRLWAPWRRSYVAGADKGDGCFLCRASESPDRDRERYVLWRSRCCLCLLNRWPYNNGHLLVAPLEHKADLDDLSEYELLDQVSMLSRCKRALQAVLQPEGFNIGLNLGGAAGAGVPGHLHWHVVPRWSGDTNFMTVAAAVRVIPQSLEELWNLLRRYDAGGDPSAGGGMTC